MGSPVNDAAIEAVRLAKKSGWLGDGSLIQADLSEANLRKVIFDGANFRFTDFSNANLSQSYIKDTDFTEGNFVLANLTNAYLGRVHLHYAHMHRTNLNNATLEESILYRADLHQAELQNASLDWCNLVEADLRYAHLEKASLIGTNLSRADLRGANLSQALLYKDVSGELAKVKKEYACLIEAFYINEIEISTDDTEYMRVIGKVFRLENLSPHEQATLCKCQINEIKSKKYTVILSEAKYDSATTWPKDFDPEVAGAIKTE